MVVQSSQAGSATAAEKLGFKQGLESILEDVKVDCVATDGHSIYIVVYFPSDTIVNNKASLHKFPGKLFANNAVKVFQNQFLECCSIQATNLYMHYNYHIIKNKT